MNSEKVESSIFLKNREISLVATGGNKILSNGWNGWSKIFYNWVVLNDFFICIKFELCICLDKREISLVGTGGNRR